MKIPKNPEKTQEKILLTLVKKAKNTKFGQDHQFEKINNYKDFIQQVPLRTYEDFLPYIQEILEGKNDILWSKKPLYLAKTSGTTAQVKYIPITQDSIHNHVRGARNALLNYLKNTGNIKAFLGKVMFLQGNPKLEYKHGIAIGRLSGIVAHHVPWYLKHQRLPTFFVNTIDNWEEKVDQIVEETKTQDLRVLGGIPIWLFQYFEKLLKVTKKQNILEIFPNFSLLIYGGVNYLPYQNKMEKLIGKKIDSIEVYPASEGFFAYQNGLENDGLVLILNDGIFYEFIPMDTFHQLNPTRLSIKDVKKDVQYALIINSNAGLWGYILGDTIKFTSLNPYKIRVTGRVQQFISAFGEHVIAEEVEEAIQKISEKYQLKINEFTVAPQVNPTEGKPYHQWFIEWTETPTITTEILSQDLDIFLQEKNIYYKDLRQGNILNPIKIVDLPVYSFEKMMKNRGKLGEQNKVPRLANHREFVSEWENL